MDQDVIYKLKSYYRRLLLQSLVAKMSTCSSMNELAKEITIFDVVQWIVTSLQRIQADTIIKCFLKASFTCEKFNQNPVMDEASENLITIQKLCRETDTAG